jgi:hypothetical protein
MNTSSTFNFRWRSWLGMSVALLLFYGAANVLAAIIVPVSLHRNGPWAVGGLVLTEATDTAVLGPSLTTLSNTDPALRAFLVSFMDTMCAFMMAFAILHLAVVWFGLRRAQLWALWAVAMGDLAIVPYYAAISITYDRVGVPLGSTVIDFVLAPAAIILVATALGWFGLRRAQRQSPATA